MKKMLAGVAVAALLLAGPATAAMADEAVPPAETVVVETPTVEEAAAPVEETPVVDPAPVEEVPAVEPESAPEVVVEEKKADVKAEVAVDETPYVLFAWSVPNPADVWEGDQTLVNSIDLATADLGALDSWISEQCGYFQVDLENDSAITRELQKYGLLHDAGNPTEDHAYNAPGLSGNPWKYVTGENCEEEPPPVINECVEGEGSLSTNLNDLWSNVDTRSKGHVEYVENGLHVWTEDSSSQSKVSEGIAVNFALANTGVLDIDVTEQPGNVYPYGPGLNLFVTSSHGNATFVYEEVYGQDLWVTNGSAQWYKDNAPSHVGGNGSENHGTINEWLAVDPTIQVVGLAYTLGSGVQGDWVINSITANCAVHTFDYEELPAPTTRTEVLEDLPDCDTNLVTITTKNYETPYQGEEVLVSTVVTTREATNEDYDALECGITPGDILATCVGDVPYLSYDVDAPQEGPLTITFVNPDGENYVVENADRSGTILWPGASLDPQNWPGWELNADGSYSETDGNFAWTREGVTVAFDINPHYETVVSYPEASALCANPPAKTDVPTTPTGDLANTGGALPIAASVLGGLLALVGTGLVILRRRQTA